MNEDLRTAVSFAARNLIFATRYRVDFQCTLGKFADNSIFGSKRTFYVPDDDFSGWTPSNYFSGASMRILVSAALGPSSS